MFSGPKDTAVDTCVAGCALQCVSVCYSVLHCAAVCCIVLQCVTVCVCMCAHIASYTLLYKAAYFCVPSLSLFVSFSLSLTECWCQHTATNTATHIIIRTSLVYVDPSFFHDTLVPTPCITHCNPLQNPHFPCVCCFPPLSPEGRNLCSHYHVTGLF